MEIDKLAEIAGKCRKLQDQPNLELRIAAIREMGYPGLDHQITMGSPTETFCLSLVRAVVDRFNVCPLLEWLIKQPEIKTFSDTQYLQRLINDKCRNQGSQDKQRIHIITGNKGGVGKTLISLALACYYNSSGSRPLLAADLNTTNADLHSILSRFQIPNGYHLIPGYDLFPVTDFVYTLRPHEPYEIKGGASSFWGEVKTIQQKSSSVADFDLVIDTSQNVANLVTGKSGFKLSDFRRDFPKVDAAFEKYIPSSYLSTWEDSLSFLTSSNMDIFVWIIWTWASFQDSVRSVFSDALWRLNETNKVNVVHVLNPSALINPRGGVLPTFKNYIRWIEKKAIEKERAKKDFRNNLATLERVTEEADKAIQWFQERLQELPDSEEHAVAGLHDLMKLPATGPIPYKRKNGNGKTFEIDVVKVLKSVSPVKPIDSFRKLYEGFIDYGGRPNNILCITKHNPKLRGYTELFCVEEYRPQSFDELSKKIDGITKDIAHFMKTLTPGKIME